MKDIVVEDIPVDEELRTALGQRTFGGFPLRPPQMEGTLRAVAWYRDRPEVRDALLAITCGAGKSLCGYVTESARASTFFPVEELS